MITRDEKHGLPICDANLSPSSLATMLGFFPMVAEIIRKDDRIIVFHVMR